VTVVKLVKVVREFLKLPPPALYLLPPLKVVTLLSALLCSLDTAILTTGGDLIAVVQDNTTILTSLTSSMFVYV